jgi:hypothetical protein
MTVKKISYQLTLQIIFVVLHERLHQCHQQQAVQGGSAGWCRDADARESIASLSCLAMDKKVETGGGGCGPSDDVQRRGC